MKHILWLLKQGVISFVKCDYNGLIEVYWLLRLHLTHKSTRIK